MSAAQTTLNRMHWHALGVFDGENAERERICEFNINQPEAVDSTVATIVVVFDQTYKKAKVL
jgi:hypothetical protein